MFAHHERVEKKRGDLQGLIINFGKTWNLGTQLGPPHPQGGWLSLNYGWYLDTAPYVGSNFGYHLWQQLSSGHNDAHVDYSQVFWAVHPMMIVDGQPMPTADVLRSAELAGMISHQGPLPFTRHPRLPVQRLALQSVAPPIDSIRMVGAPIGSATSGGWIVKGMVVAGLLWTAYYIAHRLGRV
jgi:hypothetical protein